jgi:hypothetical protein
MQFYISASNLKFCYLLVGISAQIDHDRARMMKRDCEDEF